jgi:multicomponent Na+:H+ antiporter subunit B
VTRVDEEPMHRPGVGLVLVLAIGGVLAAALLGLPRETSALPAVAREAMVVAVPVWRTTEPVSEVVYGTRGIDTFGETFLLLSAVISIALFTRRKESRRGFVGESSAGDEEQREDDPKEGHDPEQRTARDAEADEWALRPPGDRPATPDAGPLGAPSPERSEAMSVVARVAVRAVSPVLATAALYLVVQGYSPGGGFPGGAVALGVVLLVYAGFGYRRVSRAVSGAALELVELAGALVIVLLEALGLFLSGSFSANWLPLAKQQTLLSGGVLQVFNASEFVEVGTGLTLAIFAVMTMRHDWAVDEAEDDSGDDASGDVEDAGEDVEDAGEDS